MNDKTTISLIIPTRDRKEMLRAFIESIRKYTTISYEILVSDDASTDGTGKMIFELIEDPGNKIFDYTYNAEPKYFAPNCNEMAKKANGKYVMFLNDDMLAIENWINKLPEIWERLESEGKKIGQLCVKTLNPNGTIQVRGWRFAGLKDFGMQGGGCHEEKITRVHWGGLPFMTKERFLDIGGFTHFGKMGYEDTDLGFKLMKEGFENFYVPDGGAIHMFHKNHYTEKHEAFAGRNISAQFTEKWKDFIRPY